MGDSSTGINSVGSGLALVGNGVAIVGGGINGSMLLNNNGAMNGGLIIGGNGNSPHGDAYKSSKRNNPTSSLEYQYATNSNNILGSNNAGKGGGFFPNLRSKNQGGITGPRENSFIQNGQNSLF